MSEKQPVWFIEWRELYWKEIRVLGVLVQQRFNGRSIRMDRILYHQIRRVNRINRRLDLECDVKDITFCMDFLRMLSDEDTEE